MGAALVILIFSLAGLAIASVIITSRVTWAIIEALARFIRHEMLMRPKERYYRM